MPRDSRSPLTVLQATATTNLPDIGIRQGKTFYLVFDERLHSFHLIWWDRIHWLCSCDKGACTHKLAVNDFVFEESQKRRITGDDLTVHIEDDLNR